MGGQPVIEAVRLTKAYGGTTVVRDLNLSIGEGEVFGFLGPNGAGKTTSMLMLLGMTEPTSGTARVAGFNSTREPLKVKRVTGYVPEKVGFYEDTSAVYNLEYMAELNRIPEAQAKAAVMEALEAVGLKEKAYQRVGTFSKGMKQRLAIADILVKAPRVAFLDEPTSGIDPEGVSYMLDLIGRIARERQMTIVLSSHQLNQVERVCSRVGIMSKGKLVVEGPLDQLGKKAGGNQFKVEIELTEVTPAVSDAVSRVRGVLESQRSGNTLTITCSEDLRAQLARAIVDGGGLVVRMDVQKHALEDIYLKYFKEG